MDVSKEVPWHLGYGLFTTLGCYCEWWILYLATHLCQTGHFAPVSTGHWSQTAGVKHCIRSS